MAEITLKAATGRGIGTGPSKRLRVEGMVPGVVYGLGADPVAVTVEWRSLREALTTDAGLNVLLDLEVDGEEALCIVKDLQRHPIKGNVLHLDFLRVDRDVLVTVDVPVVLHGEALEVERADGTVDHLLFSLSVNAKPADIPNEIAIDISGLVLGDQVKVGDLVLPSGVTTDLDPEELVITTFHSAAEEPAAGEGGESAEGGEGEGGEAAAEGSAEGGTEA